MKEMIVNCETGEQTIRDLTPEEIAFAQKWITADALEKLAKPLSKNTYGQYLLNLLK